MRKMLIAAAAATTLLTGSALADTIVIQKSDPAPTGAVVVDEVPSEVTTYVRQNPIDAAPVLEGRLVNGAIVPADVQLVPVQGYSGYSYFYQDGAPVIVDSGRRVVQVVR